MAKAVARRQAQGRSGRGAPPKYVYAFGKGKAEGSSALRDLLGGKGC